MRNRLIKLLLSAFVILLPYNTILYVIRLNSFFHLPQTVELADYLFLIAVLLSMPEIIKNRKLLFGDNFVKLSLVAVTYLLINALLSDDINLSFVKFVGKCYLLSIPLLYLLHYRDQDGPKRLLAYFSFSYLIIGMLGAVGIIFYYAGFSSPMASFMGDIPASWHVPRLNIFFPSPDALSVFLITGAFLAWHCLKQGIFQKRLLILAIALGVASLMFTFSRNIWAASIGLGAMFFYRNNLFAGNAAVSKIAALAMYAAYVILIFAVVFLFTYVYIFPIYISETSSTGLLDKQDGTYKLGSGSRAESAGLLDIKWFGVNTKLHNRALEAADAWRVFLSHPIKGIGVGISPSHGYYGPGEKRDAHNTYLMILSQLGLLGFGLVVIFFVMITRRIRALAAADNGKYAEFGRVMFAVIGMLLAAALFCDLDDYRHIFLFIAIINLQYWNYQVSQRGG